MYIKGIKVRSYIARYPVHMTAQSTLHPLADLFIPRPSQLLTEVPTVSMADFEGGSLESFCCIFLGCFLGERIPHWDRANIEYTSAGRSCMMTGSVRSLYTWWRPV